MAIEILENRNTSLYKVINTDTLPENKIIIVYDKDEDRYYQAYWNCRETRLVQLIKIGGWLELNNTVIIAEQDLLSCSRYQVIAIDSYEDLCTVLLKGSIPIEKECSTDPKEVPDDIALKEADFFHHFNLQKTDINDEVLTSLLCLFNKHCLRTSGIEKMVVPPAKVSDFKELILYKMKNLASEPYIYSNVRKIFNEPKWEGLRTKMRRNKKVDI